MHKNFTHANMNKIFESLHNLNTFLYLIFAHMNKLFLIFAHMNKFNLLCISVCVCVIVSFCKTKNTHSSTFRNVVINPVDDALKGMLV
jgi:hypothetical protein